MNIQAKKMHLHLHLPLLVGGIAAILISGIAIAALALSAQEVNGAAAPAAAVAAAEVPAAAGFAARSYRCAGCGVIESMREIDVPDESSGAGLSERTTAGKLGQVQPRRLPNYEITIRLQDGSMRVIRDARPAKWRPGEPVTIISGVD